MPSVKNPLLLLGIKIKSVRESQKISLAELSNRLEMSENYLKMVEHGQTNLSLLKLFKIALSLNIHPADLVLDIENESLEL